MIRNFEKLLTDHPDMCCEVEPKDYPPYLDYPKERKPMTNYDQIINKTPEELAEWLCDVAGWLPAYEGKVHPILKWLKSPVEDQS